MQQYPNVSGIAFKPIKKLPGYVVGDDGSVWSSRRGNEWRNRVPTTDRNRYLRINLSHKGRKRAFFVHTLILSAFIGSRPKNHETAHNNGIRDDNRLSNLRWATKKENCADQVIHGTRQGVSKLTTAQVKEIRVRCANQESGPLLAHEFGVSYSAIYAIATRKYWKHVM